MIKFAVRSWWSALQRETSSANMWLSEMSSMGGHSVLDSSMSSTAGIPGDDLSLVL
jgi:hypothetical protein